MPLPAGPEAPELAWGEAEPGQGGPVALTAAPTLTRVLFPQEPEAGRGRDDSHCAETSDRGRGRETETETERQTERQRDMNRETERTREAEIPERDRDTEIPRDRDTETQRPEDTDTRPHTLGNTETDIHSARDTQPLPTEDPHSPSPASCPRCLRSPQAPRHQVPHIPAS